MRKMIVGGVVLVIVATAAYYTGLQMAVKQQPQVSVETKEVPTPMVEDGWKSVEESFRKELTEGEWVVKRGPSWTVENGKMVKLPEVEMGVKFIVAEGKIIMLADGVQCPCSIRCYWANGASLVLDLDIPKSSKLFCRDGHPVMHVGNNDENGKIRMVSTHETILEQK